MQNIEFNGEFEEETDVCIICGGEANLTGWNEEKDLSRFECPDCGAIYIYDSKYNETMIKGEKRDWAEYFSENLTLPFNGIVSEPQGDGLFEETGPVRYGDKVTVNKIVGEDDLYGVIVDIKIGKKGYQFPLCDIAADDVKSPNYKIIDNYHIWFANCR
ncbi:MAG: calcium-binding protein [Oscillospiraceae bacterium]|nr:calcium-binding protein [Oscillospiraceae bacterium]